MDPIRPIEPRRDAEPVERVPLLSAVERDERRREREERRRRQAPERPADDRPEPGEDDAPRLDLRA